MEQPKPDGGRVEGAEDAMVGDAGRLERQRHQPPAQPGHRIGIGLAGGAERIQLGPLVRTRKIDIRIGSFILAHHHEGGGLVRPGHLGKVGGHIRRGIDGDIAAVRAVQRDGMLGLFRQRVEIARRGEDRLARRAVDAVIDHIGKPGLAIGAGERRGQIRGIAALDERRQVENRNACEAGHAVLLRTPSRSAWRPSPPA